MDRVAWVTLISSMPAQIIVCPCTYRVLPPSQASLSPHSSCILASRNASTCPPSTADSECYLYRPRERKASASWRRELPRLEEVRGRALHLGGVEVVARAVSSAALTSLQTPTPSSTQHEGALEPSHLHAQMRSCSLRTEILDFPAVGTRGSRYHAVHSISISTRPKFRPVPLCGQSGAKKTIKRTKELPVSDIVPLSFST